MYKIKVNYNGTDYDENTHIDSSNYDEMVLDNYMKGFLFMLATFGALDVAYVKPDTIEFGKTSLRHLIIEQRTLRWLVIVTKYSNSILRIKTSFASSRKTKIFKKSS
jgi:hypothetical protein